MRGEFRSLDFDYDILKGSHGDPFLFTAETGGTQSVALRLIPQFIKHKIFPKSIRLFYCNE